MVKGYVTHFPTVSDNSLSLSRFQHHKRELPLWSHKTIPSFACITVSRFCCILIINKCEESCLLGSYSLHFSTSLPTFQICWLPPSSFIVLIMEAESVSETSVNLFCTAGSKNQKTGVFLVLIFAFTLNWHSNKYCIIIKTRQMQNSTHCSCSCV